LLDGLAFTEETLMLHLYSRVMQISYATCLLIFSSLAGGMNWPVAARQHFAGSRVVDKSSHSQ